MTSGTALLAGTVSVLRPGMQTTVQDLAGRGGMWDVGVPPSGAWDDLSFALANLAVGNPPGAAGLEAVMTGPVLRFARRTTVCLTGAASAATLDGRPLRLGVVTTVAAGSTVDIGPCAGPGMRAYLAVGGGVRVPEVFGSRATFLLGGFGGLGGRALAEGDELPVGRAENLAAPLDVAPLLPPLGPEWTVRVLAGPHGAPEHLTEAGVGELLAAAWTVDHRADRTGVRLTGPAPRWARVDGGEAGLHPSNIHDSAYPVGGIMLAGDTPVIVGPDGPSLGGFVVPFTVVRADRWKLAQARPGDRMRLELVSPAEAGALNAARAALLADPRAAVAAEFERTLDGERAPVLVPVPVPVPVPVSPDGHGTLAELPATGYRPALALRRAGDHHLLAEAGPAVLDLHVRLWIHLLAEALRGSGTAGVREIVEGVRSLLVQVDEELLPLSTLAGLLAELAESVPDPAAVTLDVREVTLPIAFDHPAAHEAMARYARSVRPDAPWCPDNVEFIRRINDLPERADVFRIVREATYLVVGLGDVYLGAPVALPIDPRHRLVTTKYDPARTWTPQNAVGIGGVYLCVYGMEGPGGYQLVGRTVPVWRHVPGSAEPPWLLRHFDRLRFRPVDAAELADLRADVKAGRSALETRAAKFSLSEVDDLEAQHRAEIAEFRERRQAAFVAERLRWET
ncbi:5-oxoprolinase/urea amidolyase family protein [Amycolatopsis sp. H20-H5]|uniref:5-oxoprolinase/urea amidolyase family protein n=1 Tax=Amycolatopsis sp. H20-H5 TaxID=3046309 RepID=UPI002DBAC039|nr:5-oxoprolinase/urea amidolyase family protein [Amycolatopsis sp. H20-H5]MEC3979453.1 5-oxoprolinase/urea amidolyase family protein [Amycolatopsis sp. H20-H5]